MPARSHPLPSEFELNNDTGLVRCKICKAVDPAGLGKWINKGSYKRHLESDRHSELEDVLAMRSRLAAEDAKRLQTAYASADDWWNADSQVPNPRPSNTPGLFDTVDPVGADSAADNHVFDDMPELIPTYISPIVHDPDDERERLRREVEILHLQAEEEDEFGEDLEDHPTVAGVADKFRALGLDNPFDNDEGSDLDHLSGIRSDPSYSSYPNKVTMLLDIIDNLPRLRMSSAQFRMILWTLRECGVKNVPSFHAFRKMQASLRSTIGGDLQGYTSSLGNRFYVNDVRNSVAKDFSNPEIAKHLHFYPEETDGPVSEVWQAQRWKDFKPSERTPMYAKGLKHFYIDEVARLQSGELVIPRSWIIRGGRLCADCTNVVLRETGWICGQAMQSVPADDFLDNYFDVVQDLSTGIPWAADVVADIPQMPNRLRELAEGEDLVVVMLPIWCDDVSGNRSKQYNKHINMYMSNSNLPGRLLQSTHSNPIRCYNAATHRKCRAILRCPDLPADNPQQSEEASHMGGNANCKCRKCKQGGPHAVVESDEGYHQLHYPGDSRTAAETKVELEAQIHLAKHGVEKPILDRQTATGTKDKIVQHWIDILLSKSRTLKADQPGRSSESIAEELQQWLDDQPGEKLNPLLLVEGLDVAQDTPVEILHTVLLGIIKYAWHGLHTSWKEKEQDLFYRNGLIGKHFKTLMQTMVFHVHDLVTPDEFILIKALGSLGAMLWVHEIENMDEYTADLEVLIGNVLDAFGTLDPAKVLKKMKLHILPHLIEDVKRFGPTIRKSTEIFECFNAIFRLRSVLSNHLAPSRDIASKFISMDRLKHILSGGFWEEDGEWVQAGHSVRDVLKNDPIIQRHLGWVPPQVVKPGHVRRAAVKKAPARTWGETRAASNGNEPPADFGRFSAWCSCISVVAQSGDKYGIGSWVVAQQQNSASTSNSSSHPVFGRITEIITADGSDPQQDLVTLEEFHLGGARHPEFDMPVLGRSPGLRKLVTVSSQSIQFIISVQHDCRRGKCEPSAFRNQMQEREVTDRQIRLIAHSDDDHFVLNMHALHNASLIRKLLPRTLTAPAPLFADRRARHYELAALLRISQADKREKTAAKMKATRETNKAKKAARGQPAPAPGPRHDEETAMEAEIEKEKENLSRLLGGLNDAVQLSEVSIMCG
ncbi:hypothetical protein PLICRDRAFT_179320 [Plicaturopsis crispa FD-325 SS-3]|uniref:Uncharacterized protein n=1 Tax=Plicaturopsis crispa FD-325 SS-3 TaxID=944288 RepID=A0A0C9SRA0_PLICR|nr:hypothetical protein PLICRDRAFT_179320 [Plicaturopsis crispa FD-325 SS-3]